MPQGEYLRYTASAIFGLVGCGRITYLNAGGREARLVAVSACEQVLIWDLVTKDLIATLTGDRHEVTALARSPDHTRLAVGYRDGAVRVFDVQSSESKCSIVFLGHRRAITALAFDHSGMRLASGSQDTDVTLWDLVSESGQFRLKGHTNEITKIMFFKDREILVTSSKDKLVKFWDLHTQHCFRTLASHRAAVNTFVLVKNDHQLVTGSEDSELRVWNIRFRDEEDEEEKDELPAKRIKQEDSGIDEDDDEDEKSQLLRCESKGSVLTESRGKITNILTDPSGRYLLCHGPAKKCEVFLVATDEELRKTLGKRRKKARMRLEAAREKETIANGVEPAMEKENITVPVLTVEDELRRVASFRVGAKLRGMDFVVAKPQVLRVTSLLNSNCVETALVEVVDAHSVNVEGTAVVQRNGHRTEVRTVAFSSDSSLILSASAEQAKIWLRYTQEEQDENKIGTLKCTCTMDCGYALCSTFAPGDRHVIVGTKDGKLQVFDISSRLMTACIDAHTDSIWSLCLAPKEKNGIITGSKDHTVKFWSFELVKAAEDGRKQLTLVHTRTLQLEEQITCVTYSPDQRLIAVALLDNTVKVFFVDTLKLFLTLYGGSTPVLSMDISTDSTIIATGAADKNLRLWGLDFGDLRKTLFAHDDSVSCVRFVPKTHMLFTGSKDRLIKQWDADHFQHILTLKGHQAEVRALAVSPCGNFVVSSSHDFSLRLWSKTDELLVLHDEREQEREQEEDEAIVQTEEPVVAGEARTEVMAARKTADTLKGVEKLVEAIDVYEEETKKLAEHSAQCKQTGKELPKPASHPLMVTVKSPAHYVLKTLREIRSSDIEEALLVLPFDYMTKVLTVLELFLQNGWETELSTRCVCFLLRIHHGSITSNQVMLPTIQRLQGLTKNVTRQYKDMIGFNLHAMRLLKLKLDEKNEQKLFADATARFKEKKKKKKKVVLPPVLA